VFPTTSRHVYYSWQPDQNAYAVVDPPDNADAPYRRRPLRQRAGRSDAVLPRDGQTKEQAGCRPFECYNWAKGQTGFDPTQPGGESRATPTQRAAIITARCLRVCRAEATKSTRDLSD